MSKHFMSLRSTRLPAFRALAAAGILAGVAALAGCNLDTGTAPASGPQAFVNFINTAPRYNSLSLSVDSTLLASALPYGSGLTVIVAALDAPRHFTIFNDVDSTAVATSDVQVENQATYSLVVTQEGAGAGVLVLPDTASPPPSGQVGLRVVNVSPGVGSVDVYVTGADTALTTPTASDVTFENIAPYVDVSAGTARVRITAHNSKTVLLDISESQMQPGAVHTILLVDSVGSVSPVTWLEIQDRA